MLRDLTRDAAYAVRSLAANPAFTAVALVTLALGIGANTAIFTVLNAVLLRPFPYRDADRLVFVWSSEPRSPHSALTPGRFVDFRERLTSIEGLSGIGQFSVNLAGGPGAERISASSVSSGFFDVLGMAPLLGDTFHADRVDVDDVVLSYGFWVRRFGANSNLIGNRIVINGRPRRVVAVMPKEFAWPTIAGGGASVASAPELWLPAARHDIPRNPGDDPNQDLSTNRRAGFLRAVGRLAPGVTLEQARREVETLTGQLAREYPREDAGTGGTVQPMREQLSGAVRAPLLILAAAASFVLAIACANAASLLLGRATSRRREIAVRLALGATRARIVRQLLAESMLLSLGGAGGGLVVARAARSWLVALAPPDIPRLADTGLDLSVLAFTLATSIVTGLLFGIVPAWQAGIGALTADLTESGIRTTEGRRGSRARDILVASQIATALVLLVGAGLLLRSLATLTRVDTGIQTSHLVTFEMALAGERSSRHESRVAFFTEMLDTLRVLPGVRAAGAAATLPIGGDDFSTPFVVEGVTDKVLSAGYQVVTPDYFAAMGIPLKSGRDVQSSDEMSAPPVILVNETMARWQWRDGDPIGRRVRMGRNTSSPWMTVVGVVGDVRHRGPAAPVRPEIYQPIGQASFTSMAFAVRSEADAATVMPAIRAAIARHDPAQPISKLSTMDDHIARALVRPQFMSTLIAWFAALALALSIVGIYGVLSQAVAARTREIAIRAALGARPRDVLRLVLIKVGWLSAAGVAAGLTLSVGLTRVLQGLLHGVEATDVLTYAVVVALLVLSALVAAMVPATRALRIDGTLALRS